MSSSRRAGYSYIELLIVVTIMGVLIALLLPAVQAAREAGRRISCSYKLTQLVAAVHLYELHHGFYPPGTIEQRGPIMSQPLGYHHNWITQILPFLEQKAVYRHVDFQFGVYHPSNLPVRRMDLRILRCPSSPRPRLGYSDYAGVHNDVEAPIDVDNNGVFFLNSRIRGDDLHDGTSQTLLIGEKWVIVGDLGWMSGTRATLRNTGVPINTSGGIMPGLGLRGGRWDSMARGAPAGLADDSSEPPDVAASGLTSSKPATPDAIMLDWLLGPEGQPVPGTVLNAGDAPMRRPKDIRLAVGGFSSTHPGGSSWALGDGSVRYLSQNMDFRLYGSLAHRSDGGLAGDDY